MKNAFCFLLIVLACLASNESAKIKLLSENPSSTEFQIEFDEPSIGFIGNGSYFAMDGFGPRGEEFAPRLLGKSFRVAIPKGSDVSVKVKSIEWSDWLSLVPATNCSLTDMGKVAFGDPQKYEIISGGTAKFIDKFRMRGVEIANIDIIPIQYDPKNGTRFMRNIVIEIDHRNGGEVAQEQRLYHPVFEKMFRKMLVNPESALPPIRTYSVEEWDTSMGAELLVICYPTLMTEFQAWVDWKLFMGMPTKVVRSTTAGATKTAIKNFIRNAYNTWTIPPAYVLFVGDGDGGECNIPTWEWGDPSVGDNEYGCVDGSDIYPDIFPARISCDEVSQVTLVVRKHLDYEKEPIMTDDWWARGVGIVNEDGPPYGPVDSSYAAAVKYAMRQCQLAGFSSSPVFRDSLGHTAANVRPHLSAGCNFVVYRGQAYPDYYSPFNGLLETVCGHKCPINVSITCGTGGFQNSDNFPCEFSVRAGTLTNPAGSMAFIGQTVVSTYSFERSSLTKHIFEGFFPAGLNQLGAAHTYGKNEMLAEFGAGSSRAQYEYTTSQLIGAPEMLAWTAPIRNPYINYPPAIPPGPVDFTVGVFSDTRPVVGARVAVHTGDNFSFAVSDSEGFASVPIFAEPLDLILLVVTGPNIYPFVDTIEIIASGVAIFGAPVFFTEISGNGDGLINPGEIIKFHPKIFNLGSDSVSGLSGIVRNTAGITMIDSLCDFPALGTWDTVAGDQIVFRVPTNQPATPRIGFTLEVSGHPAGPWTININPPAGVHRFGLEIDSILVYDFWPYGDDDGKLDAGEVSDICIKLANRNRAGANAVTGRLFGNSSVVVSQPNGFRLDWEPEISTFLEPYFTIDISPGVSAESTYTLKLVLHGSCLTYDYVDTIIFPIRLYGGSINRPTGPDMYGYRMVDNTDLLSGIAPDFFWADISVIGATIPEITNADDAITNFALPFRMFFYGIGYDTISASSNGFIVPGKSTFSGGGSGTPVSFPNAGEPIGIIAPCWADLAPHRTGGGEIYRYYDPIDGVFIIQWEACQYYYGFGTMTCQLRITNPSAWPTPTGDSEFYIFYRTVNMTSATGVGIESRSQTMGIQYLLNGVYDLNAAPLESGRAIRITTVESDSIELPWLFYFDSLTFEDVGGTIDGIIEPGEKIGIKMRIKNGGSADARDIRAVVVATPFVFPRTGEGLFGDIPAGFVKFNSTEAIPCSATVFTPTDTILEVPVRLFSASTTYNKVIKIWMPIGYTSIDEVEIPQGISIGKNYPNPFNSSTRFELFVGKDVDHHIKATIYDINGRQIETIVNERLSPGRHEFIWFSNDNPSGIYLLDISAGKIRKSTKIVLIK